MVTVISLFAGCGGSSLGYQMAGFKELLAVEWDKNAVETFKLNFAEVPIWQRDICEVTGKEILDFLKIKKGELDVLDGSPPCQGFSTAGKRNLNDSRNDLFKEYCRLLKDLQPKVFVMENVSGMIKGTMKGKFLEILAELKSCGYNVKVKLMNAMWYNVPQSRQRLIFIGVRNDIKIEPSFPEPSKTFITVKEAFKNCPDGLRKNLSENTKTFQVIKNMKQGESVQDVVKRLFNKNYGFDCSRLVLNKISPTIKKSLGSFALGAVHPTENRSLHIGELKRLGSYPDSFKLIGNFSEQWARIGNSVPPLMMKAIAENIKANILTVPPTASKTASKVKSDGNGHLNIERATAA